jgi:hypothetical protein
MSRKFGGVIWTNHALARLKDRKIDQGDAWVAFRKADKTKFAKSRGGWVYEKTFWSKKIEVVAKKNERGEWIILSVWTKPIYGAKRTPLLLRLFRIFFFGDYR